MVPRKSQRDREVPTSSMADIAFLLIFFLVTTILNIGQRIGLILLGQKKQPLRTRNIAELLVNADGETCFENGIVEAFEIHRRVGRRLLENQNLVIVIKIDLKKNYACKFRFSTTCGNRVRRKYQSVACAPDLLKSYLPKVLA